MQKYHMPKWEDSLFLKGQNRRRKGRKLTLSDEPTVLSVHSVRVLGTLRRRPNSTSTVGWTDGPYSTCVGWMGEMKQQKTVAQDEPTIWVRTPSVYPLLRLNQDRDAPRLELQHRMNWRWSSGSSDDLEDADSKVLARNSSAPDDPTHRRCIALEQLCQ
jgi:hypothetical protein